MPEELFTPIGEKVEKTAPVATGEQEEEFKPVDEIESLCMNCHKNVSNNTNQPTNPSFNMPASQIKSGRIRKPQMSESFANI